MLHAQEEERKRISRELHDVIAQTLVGINVHLAALIQRSRGKSAESPEEDRQHSRAGGEMRWTSCIASPGNCARPCWTTWA